MSNDRVNNNDPDSGFKLSILEIISVFLANRKKIFLFAAITCVVAIVLYFFVFDLIYASTASVKSSPKSSCLLGGLDGGLSDIGGIDDFGLGGGKTAKELAGYEEILISRRCLEPLILKFGLMEREEYDFMEDAVKDFRESKLKITQEKLAGILYITVLDKDKLLAKEMVEFLLEQLNKINVEMNVLNAKNNREFIEKRYSQAKED